MLRNVIPVVCAVATCGAVLAQEPWTLETLRAEADFESTGTLARLRQIASLVAVGEPARGAIAAGIQGDHREYGLKIARYLDQLADERWLAREDAELTLIEIGARAIAQIEERAQEGATREEQIRSRRIVDAIVARGTGDEQRELRFLRGLTATARQLPRDPRLRAALSSALGHTDAAVVDGALLALGTHGEPEDADMLAARAAGDLRSRRIALAALGQLPGEAALAESERLLTAPGLLRPHEAAALIRELWLRADAGSLLERLRDHPNPLVANLASFDAKPGPAEREVPVAIVLADRGELTGGLRAMHGTELSLTGAIEALDPAYVAIDECATVVFPHELPARIDGARLFLNQGTLLVGELSALDAEAVTIDSGSLGQVRLPRSELQGLALDPKLDRLVGASSEFDRIRLRNDEFIDGDLLGREDDVLLVAPREAGGEPRRVPLGEVAGVLFRRPPPQPPSDTLYSRVELAAGERLLAQIGLLRGDVIGVDVPGIGSALLPISSVARIEFNVGGGALWGFTIVADYSANTVSELDEQGRVVFTLADVYGAWDAECLDNGNLLVTEFAMSRVVEITRSGEVVWSFTELMNPYDADRLPDGNTLIADTFGDRVVEVSPAGEIVWTFGGVKPYDVERLANGNTLIADAKAGRVIEVSPDGQIVWQITELVSVHDADRLPNGNTLIAQRTVHRVVEVDQAGNIVFAIEGLSSPSDADRLPNGHTLVAESGAVREYDRSGRLVQEIELPWAVEVNRY